MRTLRAAFALALALGACSPTLDDAYMASFAAGERAMHAGRCDEAARAYSDAVGRAARVKDRDEALYLEAGAYHRCRKYTEEEATFRKLVAASPNGPRTSRVRFEIANVEIEHGDAERGYTELAEAMRLHPEHGNAHAALEALLRREQDKGGDAGALAWLRSIAPTYAKTELDQSIAYEIARTLERLGNKAEAREAFVATARAHPYPFGSLTDDALMHASELDVELGHPDRAIEDLRMLLSPREGSGTVGSYQRPLFSKAQLRIAEIYRDELKDHASARREFEKLYSDFPTSILRDDALWSAARLAHADGDEKAACRLVTTLIEKLPESRYASCGGALCSAAPAPQAAKGRPLRECPDYILREVTAPPR
jgi:tetratricopeptide (TPR) repeat protein